MVTADAAAAWNEVECQQLRANSGVCVCVAAVGAQRES